MAHTAKKILFAALSALAAVLELFALPGVQSELPDASGEYVYYRDYSFNRESYVGFLYYDETAYEARYFAPATQALPEQNIDILFSVGDAGGRLELTGEYFKIPPQQEDVEIVNYIHDLMYELSARRAKVDKSLLVDWQKNKAAFMDAGIRVPDSYEQFGGPVQMLYDAAVPIFNLKKIVDYAGRDAFCAVTIGSIADAKDSSFAEFVPPIKTDGKKPRQIKSAKKETLSFRAQIGKKAAYVQSAAADKNWSLAGQNVWTLGDSAILSLQTLAFSQELPLEQKRDAARFLRLFASSKGGAYSDWSALEIHAGANRIKIAARTYNPKTKKIINDIKSVAAIAKNLYGCFSLAVYADDYQANRGYFDKIAKSYACGWE